jgi:hypothetical protein
MLRIILFLDELNRYLFEIFTNPFLIPLAHQLIKEHSVVDQSPADDAKETDELD